MSHRQPSGFQAVAITIHTISPITAAITFNLGTSDVYCLTARNLADSIHQSLIERLISGKKKLGRCHDNTK